MNVDFYSDPRLAPRPRAEVRIESLRLIPYPDNKRVRLEFEITPFGPADRPSVDIVVSRLDGTQVASMSIIETAQRTFGVTVHLREPTGTVHGTYLFRAELYYGENPVQASITQSIVLPPEDLPNRDLEGEYPTTDLLE